jgi:hypothetical protein
MSDTRNQEHIPKSDTNESHQNLNFEELVEKELILACHNAVLIESSI